jgi:predicted GNAT superfamily acetyltransferase
MPENHTTPITVGDFACGRVAGPLLALNNAHARQLSWLEPERFATIVAHAFHASRIGTDAFLCAFDQDSPYDNTNFLWFKARYSRFVYIDRLVVAPHARGRGHARRLYMDLFASAARAGHRRIVCEINADPPNPASDAFHATLGFATVGTATLDAGMKTVRYFVRDIL